jgi:hypothetical protein
MSFTLSLNELIHLFLFGWAAIHMQNKPQSFRVDHMLGAEKALQNNVLNYLFLLI